MNKARRTAILSRTEGKCYKPRDTVEVCAAPEEVRRDHVPLGTLVSLSHVMCLEGMEGKLKF